MEISKAKYFVYLCTNERGIHIGRDITDVMYGGVALYGIDFYIETIE
jgi:hypothetical protein